MNKNTSHQPVIQIQSLSHQGMTQGLHQGIPAPVPAPMVPAYQPAYAAPQMEYAAVVVEAPRKKNPFMVYWNKIGGGSFIISLLIHAGILMAAYFIVDVIVQDPPVDFNTGSSNKAGDALIHEIKSQKQENRRNALNTKKALSKITVNGPSTVSLPEAPEIDTQQIMESTIPLGNSLSSPGFGTNGTSVGFGNKPGIGSGGQAGFAPPPPSLLGRCGHVERVAKLQANGGTPQCEKAVSDALAWFKEHQNADGSWGTGNKGAMTGFALLCYLGRCETPDSEFYGETVMKGIMYLVELQKRNPNKLFSEATTGNAPVYEHGIATYALGELYSLARMGRRTLPGMREAFEAGVKAIIENQQEKGSWVYDTDGGTYQKTGREDLSVTGWQYQALKAAKLTELKIEGLPAAIEKTARYLESKQTKEGGIGNTNREAHYNQWDLTGAGVLGLQTLAPRKSAEIKKGVKFAHELHQKELPRWETAKLYNWYYYSQMFFQAGGSEWRMWNENVMPQILKNQNKDGSWIHKSASQGGNNIYSTAMCTLMLEVYFRYLKVGDKEQGSILGKG